MAGLSGCNSFPNIPKQKTKTAKVINWLTSSKNVFKAMQRNAVSYKIYFDGNDNITALGREFLASIQLVRWTKYIKAMTEKIQGETRAMKCRSLLNDMAILAKQLHQCHPCGFTSVRFHDLTLRGHIGVMVPLL